MCMLTDSLSCMSVPADGHCRGGLCVLFGRDVENGEMPDADDLVGPLIGDICYGNAKRFLGLNVE